MGGGRANAKTRSVLAWSGIGLLLLVAFGGALGAAQRTFYSASGFVTAYVEALAAHDAQAALALPGVAPNATDLRRAGLPERPSRELLRGDILPQITDITVVSDQVAASGAHTVIVRVRADGHSILSSFAVRPDGSVLGIFATWRFATTPLAVARVTVAHSDTFTVGQHTLNPRAAAPAQPTDSFSVAADYLVFTPARYELGHTSKYLGAAPTVVVGEPGRVVQTTVDTQPTPSFTDAVQKKLHAFLDACTTQTVLQPAGCPFGVEIDNRVQGTPAWTMVDYPAVQLQPGATAWEMAPSAGIVHLSVTVQSLFDGTVEQRDSDERFDVSLPAITIHPDGSLQIVVGE